MSDPRLTKSRGGRPPKSELGPRTAMIRARVTRTCQLRFELLMQERGCESIADLLEELAAELDDPETPSYD